jgi:hypothetical protein
MAQESFLPFNTLQITARAYFTQTKASLDTYEDVMEWHLKTIKVPKWASRR